MAICPREKTLLHAPGTPLPYTNSDKIGNTLHPFKLASIWDSGESIGTGDLLILVNLVILVNLIILVATVSVIFDMLELPAFFTI